MSSKFLGHQYLAKRPECGGVVAMSWDDSGSEKDNKKYVRNWLKRGLLVERVMRHEDDPMPKLCLRTMGESCSCIAAVESDETPENQQEKS